MDTKSLTPMMQQYWSIKKDYKDALLFYRLGDFYELFFDDAVKGARLLGLALTRRGKKGENSIPMCGVPYHAKDTYLLRLQEHNVKVAICEQIEPPSKKGIVNRRVVRVITPGTVIEEKLLSVSNNYLGAMCAVKDVWYAGWIDVTTGEFNLVKGSREDVQDAIVRCDPKEVLVPEHLVLHGFEKISINIVPLAMSLFSMSRAVRLIKSIFTVSSHQALGIEEDGLQSVTGALLGYIQSSCMQSMMPIQIPHTVDLSLHMKIDARTWAALEIKHTQQGGRTLLSVLNHTKTASGKRLMDKFLSSPLSDIAMIEERLACVAYLYQAEGLNDEIRLVLEHFPDAQRAMYRLYLPMPAVKDLGILRDALEAFMQLAKMFVERDTPLTAYVRNASVPYVLLEKLKHALVDDLSCADKGRIIKQKYNATMDYWRIAYGQNLCHLEQLESKYISELGIKGLKIRFNQQSGYYIEVPTKYADKMPNDFKIIHGLASTTRYMHNLLAQLVEELDHNYRQMSLQEEELVAQLVQEARTYRDMIKELCRTVAFIDVMGCFAYVSRRNKYVCPKLVEERVLKCKNARHPVVEMMLTETQFMCNDIDLDAEKRIWLITAPNMAGKSTFLRQSALIVFMAQIGCFVPADEAVVGIADALFCRVGANDILSMGQSTFMVEMLETAHILNCATEKSFVIFDEVGRGTSSHEGCAIARACLEYIAEYNGSRCLFATHYHSLSMCREYLDCVLNYTIQTLSEGGDISFQYKLVEGMSSYSYGVNVAKMAGVPRVVIERAEQILKGIADDASQTEQ